MHLLSAYLPEEESEVVFGITSLGFTPTVAQQLLTWTRQHWAIENKLHYRRDVTLREDATRMKQTRQAQVVATLNNFVVALTNYLASPIWHRPDEFFRPGLMHSFLRPLSYFGKSLWE